jgi:phosphatidylglycerol:prolipoprotein diacylglycerol transferase
MIFPQIDPVIFKIGMFSIKWYGVAYALAIAISLHFLERFSLAKKIFFQLDKQHINSLGIYAIIGIILGGRVGYVMFYRPHWFITRPLMVLNTLEGGMSFHGALIGITIAIFLFCKKYKIPFLYITDLISTLAPIGLFLGRIANFINCELYGRVTNVSWAIIFPNIDNLPRHPSQLYEALTEGLILLIIMSICFFKTNIPLKRGSLTGIFLIGYSIARIAMEEFREPDLHMGYFMLRLWENNLLQITTGQILTLPMLILGVALIANGRKKCVGSLV